MQHTVRNHNGTKTHHTWPFLLIFCAQYSIHGSPRPVKRVVSRFLIYHFRCFVKAILFLCIEHTVSEIKDTIIIHKLHHQQPKIRHLLYCVRIQVLYMFTSSCLMCGCLSKYLHARQSRRCFARIQWSYSETADASLIPLIAICYCGACVRVDP